MIMMSDMEVQALEILNRGVEAHGVSKVFALCSSGNDSLACTAIASKHPLFAGVVHIDTGIKVIDAGYRAEDHVRQICQEQGWKLLVYRALENTKADGTPDPQDYVKIVTEGYHGRGFPEAGFPGPALHQMMYTRLKERAISRLMREHDDGAPVALVTGVRMHESARRMMNLKRLGEIQKEGNRVWINPILHFQSEDCKAVMQRYGLRQNPVRDLICMSGECLCGAFAKPNELKIIEACLPETGKMLRGIEAQVKALGYPWGWDEEPPEWWTAFANRETLYEEFTDVEQHLCTTCIAKHEEHLELVKEMSQPAVDPVKIPVALEATTQSAHSLFTFAFPSVMGIQAGQPYYSTMVPINVLAGLLVFDESELPPELQSQRPLTASRIPAIANYILSNPTTYTFDSISVAITEAAQFESLSPQLPNLGVLRVPMNSMFRIIDGQHRWHGIKKALAENPDIGNESVSLLIYVGCPLPVIRQKFSDLNLFGKRPSKSIAIAYDGRDDRAILAHQVHQGVPLFRRLTDVQRTTLPSKSSKLFCLNSIYEATVKLVDRKSPIESQIETAIAFWGLLAELMPHWGLVLNGTMTAAELRDGYLHAHGVALVAIGKWGNDIITSPPATWHQHLEKVKRVDWSRQNPAWLGTVIQNGKINKSAKSVAAITNYLREIGDAENHQG